MGAICAALDVGDHQDAIVCSYAAKYASSYYGPFGEVGRLCPTFGDPGGLVCPSSPGPGAQDDRECPC
ncbi:MAG: hypothetical protein ACXWH0_04775 [Acidimicrobiia bacterium]